MRWLSKTVKVDGKPAVLYRRGATWWLHWDGALGSKQAGKEAIEDMPDEYASPLDGWKVTKRREDEEPL